MDNKLRGIKWSGLIPSLSVFSGELLGQRISLISRGDFYELIMANKGTSPLKKIEKNYLSIEEKKEIIRNEFSRHT